MPGNAIQIHPDSIARSSTVLASVALLETSYPGQEYYR